MLQLHIYASVFKFEKPSYCLCFDLRNINHLNLLQIPNNKIALPPKHFIHLSLNKIFWQLGDLYLTKLRWKFIGHDWSKWIVSNVETKLVFDKCPANSQLPTDLLHDRKFSRSQFCSVGTHLMLVIITLLFSLSIPSVTPWTHWRGAGEVSSHKWVPLLQSIGSPLYYIFL